MGTELETSTGVAERWTAYIGAALPRVLIGLEFFPQIQIGGLWSQADLYRLIATAPGFDGWMMPLDKKYDLLAQVIHGLEEWLAYRLANRLPIPLLPRIPTPTLEDFEEADAERAYDHAKAALAAGDAPIPMEEVFAAIEAEQ